MFDLFSEMLNPCTWWSHETDCVEIGAAKSVQLDTTHSRNDEAVDWTTQTLDMLENVIFILSGRTKVYSLGSKWEFQ